MTIDLSITDFIPIVRYSIPLLSLQEPFTYSNTAHSVYDEMVFMKIKEAFKDAYKSVVDPSGIPYPYRLDPP